MADDYQSTGGGLKLKGKGAIGKSKKKKSKSKDMIDYSEQTAEASSNTEAAKEGAPQSTRTTAELHLEKMQEQRAAKKLLKKASKTHRQRVEELNNYLGGLSEHYDIQKVSWTK